MNADMGTARPLTRKERTTAIVGVCSGNLVEWYDFFIYAYTSIYFASLFFPAGDQTSQLLATAGIFAVGFFMRPLGGWIFGYIADTRGRKTSMIISVFMMCGGSLMIAIMPTYASIGVAAPVLLVIARLMQGLSVGAEYGTGATYISEVSRAGRRSFYGSFQYMTIIAGQLLALLTVALLQLVLSEQDLKAWGWRVPFLIGALASIVVVYLRRTMRETATEQDMKRKESGSIKALMQHKRAVLLTFTITIGCSLYFYTFTAYMQKFLVVSVGIPAPTVSLIMAAALVAYTCPVSPEACAWWMSARCCVENLLRAAELDDLGSQRIWQLPVLHLSIAQVLAGLADSFGADNLARIAFDPDPQLEALFGRYPPLRSPQARELGFCHDGSVAGLLRNALDLPSRRNRCVVSRKGVFSWP